MVTRRVTIDLDSDLVVADEIVRGLSSSALYRQLPFGINRIKTSFIYDTRVRKPSETVAMIMCEVDLEEGDWDVYAAAGLDEIGEILGFRTPEKLSRITCRMMVYTVLPLRVQRTTTQFSYPSPA